LGIAVINPFWYTDLTENTEKERIFKGFSVSSVSSVSSVYKNHGNSQRTKKFSFSTETLQKWEELLDRDTHLVLVNTDVDFPRDQKDAKFLACALSNNVDFLITGDGDFEEAYRVINTTIISVSMFHRMMISGE
jgi:putative PIN family toxin of toxin-antitoxin system